MNEHPNNVSGNELSAWVGVSPGVINDLARRKIIVKISHGHYLLRESIKSYCAHLRGGASARGASSPELSEERVRLVREQADQIALKNRLARSELLDANEVERSWQVILRDIRAACLALPGRIAQTQSHFSAADLAAIDREIRDMLTSLGHDSL